jgi:hypothetical protein
VEGKTQTAGNVTDVREGQEGVEGVEGRLISGGVVHVGSEIVIRD